MDKKEILKNNLEYFFEKLDIHYQNFNLDNEDELIYMLHINPYKYIKSEILKSIGYIRVILSSSIEQNTIAIACTGIYKLKDADSLLSTLVAVNNANSKLLFGNIFLRNKNEEISYYYRNKFKEITEDLDENNFKSIITSLVSAIIIIYTELEETEGKR